ncbi:MAG: hypothetical protein QOI76_910, partial [Frankiales bacterium]|nr:hypothetical protein [Frankiales bacterium]
HGLVSEPYAEAKAGRLLRASKALTVAGAFTAATLAGRSRLGAAAAGGSLLAASALTRFGIFQAGLQSADDPKYTLQPQRDRLQSRD